MICSDRHLYRERERVKHDYGTREFAAGVTSDLTYGVGNSVYPSVYSARNSQKSLVLYSVRYGQRMTHSGIDVVICLHYRAAAEDIVELIEADIAPRLFEILGSVPHTRGL